MGFAHEWPGSYVRMRSWTVWQNSEEALIITSNKKNQIILLCSNSLEIMIWGEIARTAIHILLPYIR